MAYSAAALTALDYARPQDWKRIRGIFGACLPMVPEAEISYALRTYREDTRVYRVEGNGEVAGFAILVHKPGFAWLEQIAVAPEYHGHGIAKALLLDVETRAAEYGYPRIELAVRSDNANAIALYERRGYQKIDRPGPSLSFGKTLEPAERRRALPPSTSNVLQKAYWVAVYRWFTG